MTPNPWELPPGQPSIFCTAEAMRRAKTGQAVAAHNKARAAAKAKVEPKIKARKPKVKP